MPHRMHQVYHCVSFRNRCAVIWVYISKRVSIALIRHPWKPKIMWQISIGSLKPKNSQELLISQIRRLQRNHSGVTMECAIRFEILSWKRLVLLVCSRFIEIQMCAFQLLLSVDPALGRVDCSLMTDQTLMEMLIEGFGDETKNRYKDRHGMYMDVCKWRRISCDDHGRVTQINIDGANLSGPLEFCYVPPKVEVFKIYWFRKGKLTGSLDFRQLPDGMHELFLGDNQFNGEIDLAHLPDGMNKLSLNDNHLSGEIDLTHLPDGMNELNLFTNQFTGVIDLANLPHGMQNLNIANNELAGEIDLTHLPKGMEGLSLNDNRLTGVIDLTQLPGDMEHLRLENNQLTGEIDLANLPHGMRNLTIQNNELSGEIDLTRLPDGMRILYLQNNQLTGSLIINGLPQRMNALDVRGNHFNHIAVVGAKTRVIILLGGSGVTSVVDESGNEQDMRLFLR